MNKRNKALFLYSGWTLKDLEEFNEESFRKHRWQRFRDKIRWWTWKKRKFILGRLCQWEPGELDTASNRGGTIEVLDKSKKRESV